MRYTRTFAHQFHERIAPQIFIEANNLLNHTNVTSINTTATVQTAASATVPLGTITTQPSLVPTSTVLEARILQFGLRIDF